MHKNRRYWGSPVLFSLKCHTYTLFDTQSICKVQWSHFFLLQFCLCLPLSVSRTRLACPARAPTGPASAPTTACPTVESHRDPVPRVLGSAAFVSLPSYINLKIKFFYGYVFFTETNSILKMVLKIANFSPNSETIALISTTTNKIVLN